MEIIVKDNVLSENDLLVLQETMLGQSFPWYYHDNKVSSENSDHLFNFQFTHMFYRKYNIQSQYVKIIEPILSILDPSAIVRIKANLSPVSDKIIEYPLHVDYDKFHGRTAIFYVNTNNGYTFFQNGEKILTKENRLVIFDSRIQHSGTTCTDSKYRCVINFNYYNWL